MATSINDRPDIKLFKDSFSRHFGDGIICNAVQAIEGYERGLSPPGYSRIIDAWLMWQDAREDVLSLRHSIEHVLEISEDGEMGDIDLGMLRSSLGIDPVVPAAKTIAAIPSGTMITIDPDTGADIEMEVMKDPVSGAMFAIDSSFLDQVTDTFPSPFGNYNLSSPKHDDDQLPLDLVAKAGTSPDYAQGWINSSTMLANQYLTSNEEVYYKVVAICRQEIASGEPDAEAAGYKIRDLVEFVYNEDDMDDEIACGYHADSNRVFIDSEAKGLIMFTEIAQTMIDELVPAKKSRPKG